jgi:hypothetical protein
LKISAFRKSEAKYTADLWTFTESTDASGGTVRNFAFNRKITFSAVTGAFGKVDVYLADSEDDVRIFCQLFQLFGPDGNEMMEHGIWQVEMIAPYINMWGHREGFKARIAMIGVDG